MRLLRVLFFCTIAIAFCPEKLAAQTSIVYYELIQDDSVALYFNKDYMFTEKDCYDYVRRIRVTDNGDFNGYFEDHGVDNKLLGRGVYQAGLKHGYFEVYYPHGVIFCRGYYENNKPVGNWEYYYPNGLLERILSATDSTMLMVRFVDPNGNVQVDNGKGSFYGLVRGIPEFENLPMITSNDNGIMAAGEIVDGKPVGKWIIPDRNKQAYYMEKYHEGKLVKTSNVSKRHMRTRGAIGRLNTFFLGNYLTSIETFERESCSESQQYFFNRYPSDLREFSFDLRQKMNYIINSDLKSARKDYYQRGDNYMSLKFSVDNKGKPYDIQLVTDWGLPFLKVAKNSLNKTVFSNNSKTMYFHLKLSYAGGYRYKYNFRFSKRDRAR